MRISRRGPSLIVHAPAKLNLFLNVLGRRQDGFHDLETLIVSTRWFDTLSFQPCSSPAVELICQCCLNSTASVPIDGSNLILQAARLLQDHTGLSRGARIRLTKRIPLQAGLGGGSSNAAAALIGLDHLWQLDLRRTELHHLGARLGSDVNFFLDSVSASACRGRGEQTEPVTLPSPLHFVTVKPQSGLSTRDVFRGWSSHSPGEPCRLEEFLAVFRRDPFAAVSNMMFNGLEIPARRLNPEIDHVISELAQLNVPGVGMTGSGSTCFAVCRTHRQAQVVAARVRARQLGQTCVVSTGV